MFLTIEFIIKGALIIKIKEITRLTAATKKKLICAFDCETYGELNTYVMNTFVYKDKNLSFWNKEEFINFLIHTKEIQTGGMIFASNLMFDFFTVFDTSELQKNFSMLFRNGKMLKAFCYIHNGKLINPSLAKKNEKKRKLQFFDTLNFFPASVEVLGRCINFPKMEKPKFLGELPKNQEQKDYLEKYCIRDSLITCEFMIFLQHNLNYLGGNVRITAPSSSMDLWRRQFLKETLKTPEVEQIKIMYKSYYGGRTEAFKRGLCASEEEGIKPVNVFDINSLYPYCMKKALFPNPNYLKSFNMKMKDIDSYEGVTEAIVKVPYNHIPYLPMRDKKLIFGYGNFRGFFTLYELRKAIELGVNVKLYGKQLATDKLFNPFSDYVTKLWNLRKYWKEQNNPAEVVAKLCLNSLYGRFGMKILDTTEIEFLENLSKEKMRYNWKHNYKMEIVDDIVIIKKPIDKNFSPTVNPSLSAQVTAYARHELYNLLNKNPEKTFYCDTDSLFTTKNLDTSKDLGGLKLEYKFKDLVIVRPKFYGGTTTEDKEIVKIKGLRDIKTINQFSSVMQTKVYNNTKFMKFFETKRRKFLHGEEHNFKVNEKIDTLKTLNFNDNKRLWDKKFNFQNLQNSKPLLISV